MKIQCLYKQNKNVSHFHRPLIFTSFKPELDRSKQSIQFEDYVKDSFRRISRWRVCSQTPSSHAKRAHYRPLLHLFVLSRCNLTPRSRLFKELTLAHIVKKFYALYESWRTITASTRPCNCTGLYSQAADNKPNSHTHCLFRIGLNTILMSSSHLHPHLLIFQQVCTHSHLVRAACSIRFIIILISVKR
jgi:hypothetical protein